MCLHNLRVKDYKDTTSAGNSMEEKFCFFYKVYDIPLQQFLKLSLNMPSRDVHQCLMRKQLTDNKYV